MTGNQFAALAFLGVMWAAWLFVCARWNRMEARDKAEAASYQEPFIEPDHPVLQSLPLSWEVPDTIPYDWSIEDLDEAAAAQNEKFHDNLARLEEARERRRLADLRAKRTEQAKRFAPRPK